MQYFKTVYETQSITKAASILFMTPQALNKSMRNLAEEFNTEIFYRDKGKLEPTTFGKALYKEACILLKDFNNMESKLKNLASQENGRLHIAVSHGLMLGDIKNFFDVFQAKYPNIEIEFTELPDMFAEWYVEEEECDLGVSINLPKDSSLLEAHLLKEYQICAVVNSNHPLKNKKNISLEECSKYPIITKNRIFKIYDCVEQVAKHYNIKLDYALRSSNEIVWEQMMLNTNGIGIGTSYYNFNGIENYNYTIPFVEEELKWNVMLITNKKHYLSRSAVLLIDEMKDYFKENKNG